MKKKKVKKKKKKQKKKKGEEEEEETVKKRRKKKSDEGLSGQGWGCVLWGREGEGRGQEALGVEGGD